MDEDLDLARAIKRSLEDMHGTKGKGKVVDLTLDSDSDDDGICAFFSPSRHSKPTSRKLYTRTKSGGEADRRR